MLLLQEFEIEIRDKKGLENVASNNLSRLEKLKKEQLEKMVIGDDFSKEYLMVVVGEEPWYADIANFLAGKYLPKGLTHQKKKKLFSKIKYYF